MLVLTRKLNEQIRVGDVWITIVRLSKHTVRIGIEAPQIVPIERAELIDRLSAPREASATPAEAAA